MLTGRLIRAASRALVRQGYRGYGGGGTRWMAPNRYHAPCIRCGQRVPPGTGEYRHNGVRWVVRHTGGTCYTPEYTRHVSGGSDTWRSIRPQRLAFAGHQCEHRTWLSPRCPVREGLEVHHLHYNTLGRESLGDLITLCKPHHDLADARRRSDHGSFWRSLFR